MEWKRADGFKFGGIASVAVTVRTGCPIGRKKGIVTSELSGEVKSRDDIAKPMWWDHDRK